MSGFFPSLLTVIVPRHPDRGAGHRQIVVAASGLQAALRSREQLPMAATDIYVADTMGELGLFYRLAPIVFMGGSLVEHGGQNPIEAVKLGAAIVHGPHVFNFADVYEALDGAGGARMADGQEALTRQLGQLLDRGGQHGARWLPHLHASSSSSAARWSGRWPRSSRICCRCGSRWEPLMREPAFWHRPASWHRILLSPLAALYGAVAALRLRAQGTGRRHSRDLRRQLPCRRRRQDADGAGADRDAARARRDGRWC